jgi:hypothetical protein
MAWRGAGKLVVVGVERERGASEAGSRGRETDRQTVWLLGDR